jgi:hypothetical protein
MMLKYLRRRLEDDKPSESIERTPQTQSNDLFVAMLFTVKGAAVGEINLNKNRENPLPLGRVRKAGSPTGCGFGTMIE